MDWSQFYTCAAAIVSDFREHKWLFAVAALFAIVTGVWRGTIRLPAPADAWIRAEQAKRFSASFQYITIALVMLTAFFGAFSAGLPLKESIGAAISAAVAGLCAHDGAALAARGMRTGPGAMMAGLMLMLALSVPGCAWLRSTFGSGCGSDTIATIQTAQNYTNDAFSEIMAEEQVLVQMQGIPAATLATIEEDLDKAAHIVQAASEAETVAMGACTKIDVAALLGGLVAIFSEIEPLIAPYFAQNHAAEHTPAVVPYLRARGVR